MKNQINIILWAAALVALFMASGCSIFGTKLNNAALATEIDFTIIAPNVVEGNEKEPWYKAIPRRKKMHAHWRYRSPKNISADAIVLSFDPMTMQLTSSISNLVTTVDPKVVLETGKGQGVIATAEGDAAAKLTENIAKGVVEGLGAAINPAQ